MTGDICAFSLVKDRIPTDSICPTDGLGLQSDGKAVQRWRASCAVKGHRTVSLKQTSTKMLPPSYYRHDTTHFCLRGFCTTL